MTALNFDIFWKDHGASAGMKKLGDDADKGAKRMQALGKIGTVALVGLGAAAVKFGSDSVKAYTEAQTAQAKLQDAFKRFPKLADTNITALRNLNAELAKKTRFDDDATASGQAVLAQFNLTGQQITKLTPLLQDYAAKTGKDLPDAAKSLGKAILGNGRALKDVGIDFKDTGDKGKNFDQIMGGLRRQVGGFAEKEGKTAAGKLEILKNQFGELQEAAGGALAPNISKVVTKLTALSEWAQKTDPSNIEALAIGIAGLAGSVKLLSVSTSAGGIGALVTGLLVLDKKSAKMHDAFQAIGGDLLEIGDEFVLWKAKILGGLADVATGWAKINPLMRGPAKALREMAADADKELTKVKKRWQDTQDAILKHKVIAKFQADKKDLDTKIAAARRQLKDPDLTKTRRANLEAKIDRLLAAKARAQAAINSLHGKNVDIWIRTHRTTYYGVHGKPPTNPHGDAYGGPIRRAGGGSVPGWSPSNTADNIPAMLTAGEYVQPVSAVRKYGEGGMNAIRTGRATISYDGNSSGGNTYIINAPNYVGSTNDLRRALVDMARRGELDVVRR